MAKFVVALFRNIFLPYSETFIYDSMNHYKDFTPVVFAKKRINHDFFPFDPVYVPKQICKAGRIAHLFFTTGVVSTACLAEKFKQHQPKIIHAHFGQSGVLAIPYAKKFNLPLIVTLHGNDVGLLLGKQKYLPKWWFYTLSLQRLIHTTTLFLAGSTELKERFQELGCPDNKIKVHRLAIDLNKFHLSKKENQSTSIFMVGRLVEKKGFEYGIRAFAAALNQLNDTVSSDVKLYVIGDGPLKADLKALVQSLKLQNSVHFLGKQSHEQVWKLLQTQG
ncbi:glycosyltransferase, partial [candidate division KSB1 bacterium]|nr:glycosyltransferase [candidate division KSB1 bacterium]NIR73049.1 glycosyltransferase [candidate division KSB1 bacterium]NIS26919.1 glycosyltransferase [candidate division KSB1 bacterium]NIT73760.1 glycosyltransferase [candidate division KSB1 bacterium]NIU27664.1 glycosyltransferase [candidate division KSB1 bacterium]